MAKQLSVTVIATVVFFLISFTLSQARIPSNLPENDVINREANNPFPESDVTPTIRLPSEASNEESHVDSTNGESNAVTVTTVPLKFVSFRPINRRFYTLRARFPLSRSHGRRHHNFKPLGQRLEIPYGDDMILSTAVRKDSDSMNFHGGEGQIPSRWVRLHHLHHHHHHHHDQDEMEENSMKREKTREQGGLLKRFRKFLNQLEF